MIIDSHMHLIRKKNFDIKTFDSLRMKVPEDTDIKDLINWMKKAGVNKAITMGQDMTRIWNTTFGEDYVLECIKKYPEFFIGLCSVEPLDKANRLNQTAFDYFKKSITEDIFKGVLFTPPYGQFYSNDRNCYPFL